MELKQYYMVDLQGSFEEASDGDWMKSDDVFSAISELEEMVKTLQAENRELVNQRHAFFVEAEKCRAELLRLKEERPSELLELTKAVLYGLTETGNSQQAEEIVAAFLSRKQEEGK